MGLYPFNNGPFMPFDGALAPDPSNGGRPALTWNLSSIGQSPVGNGDVLVLDPDGALSDVLRFTNAQGVLSGDAATLMIFYSQAGGGLPADTGFPANVASMAFTTVSENADGTFFYGFGAGFDNYNGVSPPVPEPGTGFLAMAGVLGLAMSLKKRSLRVSHLFQ